MLVSPSILAADFLKLGSEIKMLNSSRASMIHVDVMDGVFVPNISFGFPIIKAVGDVAEKPLDVHLMIENPQDYIEECRKCGASIVNVHQEACVHLDRVIHQIADNGMLPAVTLCPSTPVDMLRDVLPMLHMVLLMSVNPGFGGQKFISNTYYKIQRLKSLREETGSEALIEVDGGVTLANAASLAAAGVDVAVAGSAVFKAADPLAAIEALANA